MSSIPTPLLLTVSILAVTATGLLQGIFAKSQAMHSRRLWFFNAVQSIACLVSIVMVEWLTGAVFTFSAYSVWMGIGFGICVAFSVLAAVKAESIGPFNYTRVIIALSAIIPTLSGKLFFQDTIHPMQYVGVGLMLVCILLSPEKSNDDDKKANLLWLLCCGIAFAAEGSLGVWQKFHQESVHAAEMPALLITAFSVDSLFSLIMFAHENSKNKKSGKTIPLTRRDWIVSLLAGCALCFPHTINLYLVGVLPAILFFPLADLSPMILSMILAVILFREKMSVKRWIGAVIGVLSTVFVGGMFNSLL